MLNYCTVVFSLQALLGEREGTLFTERWTGTYIACEKLWKTIVRQNPPTGHFSRRVRKK